MSFCEAKKKFEKESSILFPKRINSFFVPGYHLSLRIRNNYLLNN